MERVHQALHPDEFHAKFIEAGIHARDGRSIVKCRPTSMTTGVVGTANGSCFARVGRTAVVTGIKCEVGTPAEGTPLQGVLEVNVMMTPLCSSKFSIGKPSNESLSLSRFLTRTVLKSGMVDLTQLTIVPGKAVWVLRADVVCIDHDGNVEDAAMLSLCGALRSLRLPKPAFNERKGEVTVSADEWTPLRTSLFLAPLTCAVAAGELVVDPSADVEKVSTCKFTVVYTSTGLLCGIYKPGRAAVSLSSVKAAQSLCRQRLAMLTPLFQQHAAQVELMSVAATAGGRASVVPAVGSVAGASAPSGDTPMAGIHE